MLKNLTKILRRAEDSLLVTLLCAMLGVAVYQIFARNFFSGGLVWGDTLVRITVFWVALVGAMVASRRDEHIRIDVVTRFLSPAAKLTASRVTSLFTSSLCFLFTWYSYKFVLFEYSDGVLAFGSVPAWLCESIMPVAMAVMGTRYLVHSISPP